MEGFASRRRVALGLKTLFRRRARMVTKCRQRVSCEPFIPRGFNAPSFHLFLMDGIFCLSPNLISTTIVFCLFFCKSDFLIGSQHYFPIVFHLSKFMLNKSITVLFSSSDSGGRQNLYNVHCTCMYDIHICVLV